jgi:NADPH:quinone reductase-like Zn-dependent oxidoreductase
MKAVLYTRYGGPEVLRPAEVDKPVPRDNEILVRVQASTVCAGDVKVRSFKDIPLLCWIPYRLYLGLFKPRRRILGMELSGVVESLGGSVKNFRQGDAVFALTPTGRWGGYAEYICLPEEGFVAAKPSNMNHEEAAAVPYMGLSALFYLRKGDVRPGQKILINGASGSLGSYAVQLARHFGAEVTGVCSAKNTSLVSSLGADEVSDYGAEDFTGRRERYDLIFDAVAKSSFRRCRKALKADGTYLSSMPTLALLIQMLFTKRGRGRKALYLDALPATDDLLFLRELIEEGSLRAVIDRTYPLDKIVEAHRYVDGGHKKGNVVITME